MWGTGPNCIPCKEAWEAYDKAREKMPNLRIHIQTPTRPAGAWVDLPRSILTWLSRNAKRFLKFLPLKRNHKD